MGPDDSRVLWYNPQPVLGGLWVQTEARAEYGFAKVFLPAIRASEIHRDFDEQPARRSCRSRPIRSGMSGCHGELSQDRTASLLTAQPNFQVERLDPVPVLVCGDDLPALLPFRLILPSQHIGALTPSFQMARANPLNQETGEAAFAMASVRTRRHRWSHLQDSYLR